MRFRVMKLLLLCLAIGLLLIGTTQLNAEMTILDRTIQVSRSLSAVVTNTDGIPIANAVVEEMGADWKGSLRTTKADATGTFGFLPVKGRKIYYFHLSADGFKFLDIRMRVDTKEGKVLKLQMQDGN